MRAFRSNVVSLGKVRPLGVRGTPPHSNLLHHPAGRFPLVPRQSSEAPNLPRRQFSTTPIVLKKQHPDVIQNVEQNSIARSEPRKPSRPSAAKSSLRRVAVEAERSRGSFIRGRGKNRFVDPEVETKKVTAYCAAEQYDIPLVARLVRTEGFEVDPYHSGLYPQVIHVQTKNVPHKVYLEGEKEGFEDTGDIFIFPSGTVVAWNVSDTLAYHLVTKVLPKAAEGSHLNLLETEDLGYLEDPTREHSSIIGDTVILGTKIEDNGVDSQIVETTSGSPQELTKAQEASEHEHVVDTILAKIAFSSGLARSTKLAVLETLLSQYFNSTRTIPTMLSKGSRLPFTRSFILRKTGELLSVRAQLNLYSELTDNLPDLFWDSKHELGLEGYYDEVGRALDVGVRIKVLNEKMDYAQEIASVLRERLSEKHGLLLEWGIIALISIEVGFELLRLWKEREESHDLESTENLFRRFLKSSLKNEPNAE